MRWARVLFVKPTSVKKSDLAGVNVQSCSQKIKLLGFYDIDIFFRNPAYQLFFSIRKVMCDALISDTLPLHKLSIMYLMSWLTMSEAEQYFVCRQSSRMYLLLWFTQTRLTVWSWMEITTFHLTECPLTEPCISIQNKQIILRRAAICVLLCVCVGVGVGCVCVCRCKCRCVCVGVGVCALFFYLCEDQF